MAGRRKHGFLRRGSQKDLPLAKGSRFRYCIRPFVIPVSFEPMIEEVVPEKKISWRGELFGITALHEYDFQETGEGVSVTSRTTFSGSPVALAGILLSRPRLREMTVTLLKDLKAAAEEEKRNGRKD